MFFCNSLVITKGLLVITKVSVVVAKLHECSNKGGYAVMSFCSKSLYFTRHSNRVFGLVS